MPAIHTYIDWPVDKLEILEFVYRRTGGRPRSTKRRPTENEEEAHGGQGGGGFLKKIGGRLLCRYFF